MTATPPEMPNLERAFAAGNRFALMLAIFKCAQRGRPTPAWAARAFADGFSYVYNGNSRSWDDVFGLPRSKNKHANKVTARRELMWRIYNRVDRRTDDEPGIGDKLFSEIADEFECSKTYVSDLYYEAKRIMDRPFVKNADALADPLAFAEVDECLILNIGNDPDPILDQDDPILDGPVPP